MTENLHEVWIRQMQTIKTAMNQAQPLLNTLQMAIAHAPTESGQESLEQAHRHLAATLNQEAATLGIGKRLI